MNTPVYTEQEIQEAVAEAANHAKSRGTRCAVCQQYWPCATVWYAAMLRQVLAQRDAYREQLADALRDRAYGDADPDLDEVIAANTEVER